MTVETTVRREEFAGGQGSLSFSFKTIPGHPEHIKVTVKDNTTLVETALTYTTHFTVTLATDGVGGTVIVSPTFSTGSTYTVYRETTPTQTTDYDDFNQFPANTLEKDVDRLMCLHQELDERMDRAIVNTITNPSAVTLAEIAAYATSASTSAVSAATSATTATTQANAASTSATDAAASAASVNLPTFASGDADKILKVNTAEDGYDHVDDHGAIEFLIDGGGQLINTGIQGDIEVPFACTIERVTLLGDQSGSIVVDIWKDTYANYPPIDGDSITASAVPTISTATKGQDSTLTGWTTEVATGDILRFNVDSVTSLTRCLVSLKVKKT